MTNKMAPIPDSHDCRSISLASPWRIALDRHNAGIREKWYTRAFNVYIMLPGTTDEVGMGDFVDEHCADRLSRVWRWIGPAWYQKTVDIPKHWRGRNVFLFLERTKDTQVWVDDIWVGSNDSLSTPHEYDLSAALAPGKHTITILVDNAKLPPVGPCHQVDERTQTNWNGIVGRIELQVRDHLWIRDVQAFPDLPANTLNVVTTLQNDAAAQANTTISYQIDVIGRESEFTIPPCETNARCEHGQTITRFDIALPADIPRWDEFDVTMLRLTIHARATIRRKPMQDRCTITCGMRSFAAVNGQFVINGRPTFFRGKNDAALFPLTGYAPMDKDEWVRLLSTSRDYGINHYRFHSWCPPEAAFTAASEVGIYFQVELPNKRGITEPGNHDYTPPKEAYETLDELRGEAGDPAVRTAYLTREGERILRAYGNHPSFVMMTLGNEIGGDEHVMQSMCDHFRTWDNRHLYAMGTNHFHWIPKYRPGDEFWVTKGTAEGQHIRGASWDAECHIDHQPPSTTVDYVDKIRAIPIPVVGHEIAQFEVFPNFDEIGKYHGVLKARNFEIFRERLRKAGMLDQAPDFLKASGALSVICHREDVEAAIRTAGFGGFQMLDLQDFSGQSTALVGILDVFMDSKGLIDPARWREFCCETVSLLLMPKYTWTATESFHGRIRIAHYGPADLQDRTVCWEIASDRQIVAKGEIPNLTMPTGTLTDVGEIHVPLNGTQPPQKLTAKLVIKDTDYRNAYDLWVYPNDIITADHITVARSFTRNVQQKLKTGDSVLLMPKPAGLKQSVAMAFQTGFWSPMFRKKERPLNPLGKETPGTQGILCDPCHPLFHNFPTEFHSNWQWWQLVKHSRAVILDATPPDYRPIVQVIDGFDRNHKLGLIAEARVGPGKLLICTIDLPALQQHPEARQLLACIYAYMESDAFTPKHELLPDTVKELCAAHGRKP